MVDATDDEIAELEARLKELRIARGHAKRRGLRRSDAVRAKMSAASKAAWADPAVRAKMSAARKAAWAALDAAKLEIKKVRRRADRRELDTVPQDTLEAALFGGRRR